MGLFSKKNSGNPQDGYSAIVDGTYLGGHPLYPEKIKRGVLKLEPNNISILKGALNPLGSPEGVFSLSLVDVLNVSFDPFSYHKKDVLVHAARLSIVFIDQQDTDLKHTLKFSSENMDDVNDFMSKIKTNFYLLNQRHKQSLANAAAAEKQESIEATQADEIQKFDQQHRAPREL